MSTKERVGPAIMQVVSLVLIMTVISCSDRARQPVAYPPTWPYPELTAPAGATAHPLPRTMGVADGKSYIKGHKVSIGAAAEGTLWTVAFDSDLTRAQVNDHFVPTLEKLGFIYADSESGDRHFFAKDDLAHVLVYFNEGEGCYLLDVRHYSKPYSSLRKSYLEDR